MCIRDRSDEQAAALTSQGLTAYVSLVRRAQLERGETLLVHGASGGVGLAAVRLGAHLGAGTDYFLDRRTSLTGQLTGRFIGSAGGRTSSFASVTFGVKYHF